MAGIFVTATDTDVGKTLVAAAIACTLKENGVRVAVMKPFASGCVKKDGKLISEDVELLKKAAGMQEEDDLVCPVKFAAPLAPNWAARIDQTSKAEIAKARAAFKTLCEKYEFLVVEGVGGLQVPITDDYFVSDLIADWKLPSIIVARCGLGTLNHTMLTLEAMRLRDLPVTAIVFNYNTPPPYDLAVETNLENLTLLARRTPVLPFDHGKTRFPELLPMLNLGL